LSWLQNGYTAAHVSVLANQYCAVVGLQRLGLRMDLSNSEGYTPLHLATLTKNNALVKSLCAMYANSPMLDNGFSVSVPDVTGRTPLHWAASMGLLNIVEILLQHHANRNLRDQDGFTPLHEAVDNNHIEVVLRLLLSSQEGQEDADLNVRDKLGCTPTHLAAVHGHVEVLLALLHSGADVAVADDEGNHPVHWAAMNGQARAVKELLESGAATHARGKNGASVLHAAVGGGSVPLVSMLVHEFNCDMELKNWDHHTALYAEAMRGNVPMLELLLALGASPNACDEDGCTPLHDATLSENLDVMEILLKAPDIDIEAKETTMGCSPLHVTASESKFFAAKMLLESGADVESTNYEMETPLHSATLLGNVHMMKLLMEHGAQLECTNKAGCTLLHHAALNNPQGLELLLARGLDPDCINHEGLTPLDYAARAAQHECIDVLMKAKGAVILDKSVLGSSLHCAAASGTHDVVLAMAKEGLHLNLRNYDGSTPLHLAVKHGHVKCVSTLLDFRAVIDADDKYGDTPLHYAVMYASMTICMLLLEAGADKHSPNLDGNTPLHLAVAAKDVNLCQVLCDFQASTSIKNRAGHTPLDLAISSGVSDIEELLNSKSVHVTEQTHN